jgi:DNA-binding MarR family transcriptional regulator
MDTLNERLMDALHRTYRRIHQRTAAALLIHDGQERKAPPSINRRLVMNTNQIRQLVQQHSTIQQEQVLRELHHDGPASQKELSALFSFPPQTMTRVAEKLEQDGYVTRSRVKEDRKDMMLTLTPKGQERAEWLIQIKAQQSAEFLKPLTQEERETLLTLLDKLNMAEELGLKD